MRGVQVHAEHDGVCTVVINKNLLFLAVVCARAPLLLLLPLVSRPRATAGADARDARCAAPARAGVRALCDDRRAAGAGEVRAPSAARDGGTGGAGGAGGARWTGGQTRLGQVGTSGETGETGGTWGAGETWRAGKARWRNRKAIADEGYSGKRETREDSTAKQKHTEFSLHS